MRRAAAIAAALAFATPAWAEGELASLEFLHGCWIGTFDGSNGVQDERCFEPMYEGRYLRDTHTVLGAGYGGETIYAWNGATQRIEVTYFASDGGLLTGYVVDADDGALSMQGGRYVGSSGDVQHLRSRWVRDEEGGFAVETEREVEGAWTRLMRITYVAVEQ